MKQLNRLGVQVGVVVLALIMLFLLRGQTQQIDASSSFVRTFDNGIFAGSVAEKGDLFNSAKFWLVTEKPVSCRRLLILNPDRKSIGVLPCDNAFAPDKANPDHAGKYFPQGLSLWVNGTGATDMRVRGVKSRPVVAEQTVPNYRYVDLGYTQIAENISYLRGDDTPSSILIVFTLRVGKGDADKSVSMAKLKSWQESKGEGDLSPFDFNPQTETALEIGAQVRCLGVECGD